MLMTQFSLGKYHLPVLSQNLVILLPILAVPSPPSDPCFPSPCGPNSQCRNINGYPSCSCMINYIGTPPNCRPECVIPADCPSNQACIREKCQDPCPGSCGLYADCTVHNHIPTCRCIEGYTGDPFVGCQPVPIGKFRDSFDICVV